MNKAYKKLYSRDSKNKIRIWWLEQSDGKYRTNAGVQDGKIVTSDWTIAEGKNVGRANETTPTEQATSEIESKYEKQLKTGYSETLGGVDDTGFLEPMLAKKLKERLKKLHFPAMLDRKYNGGRVNVKKAITYTRQGELWRTIPHIAKSLEPLFKKYPKLFIDGEGYNHEWRYKLNQLMSIMRKQKDKEITPELLAESEKIIRLYVYDGYGFDDITKETGCKERREALKKLLKDYKYIVVVDYVIVKSLDELYKKYQEFVDDGYEGAMYREIDGEYEHKRSANLLKIKPEDSSEATIIEIFEGDGNWAGTAKTAKIKWNDETFDATFKGSYEELQPVLKNRKDWIGKEVTFLYLGLTGKGIPNSARIDINNCFKK